MKASINTTVLFCLLLFFWKVNSQTNTTRNNTSSNRNVTQDSIDYAARAKIRSDYTALETLYYIGRVLFNVSSFERGRMVDYFHYFDFRNIKTLIRTWFPNDYITMYAEIDTTSPYFPQILKHSGGLTKVTRISAGRYTLEYLDLKLLDEKYPYISYVSAYHTLNHRFIERPTLTECTILFVNTLDVPFDPDYFYIHLFGY